MITPEAIDRLKSQLMTGGLNQKEPALFQVINQLIDATRQALVGVVTINTTISGGGGSGAPLTSTYLTETNESGSLFNSRRLLAGTNITLDVSVPNEMTINSVPSFAVDYVVMSDGGLPTPLPVDDGFGNFIYVGYTP